MSTYTTAWETGREATLSGAQGSHNKAEKSGGLHFDGCKDKLDMMSAVWISVVVRSQLEGDRRSQQLMDSDEEVKTRGRGRLMGFWGKEDGLRQNLCDDKNRQVRGKGQITGLG